MASCRVGASEASQGSVAKRKMNSTTLNKSFVYDAKRCAYVDNWSLIRLNNFMEKEASSAQKEGSVLLKTGGKKIDVGMIFEQFALVMALLTCCLRPSHAQAS